MAFALTIEMQEALSKLGLRPHILDDRPQRLRLLTLAAACHDDPDPIGSHEPAGSAADLGGCHCAELCGPLPPAAARPALPAIPG